MTQETKGYALKLYNRELMSFNLSYDRFANLKVEVTDCDLSTKKLWPMGMSPESLENDIASWAKSRTIRRTGSLWPRYWLRLVYQPMTPRNLGYLQGSVGQ